MRNKVSPAFSFDSTSHRFWAIRHDPVSDQILFQTASAGGVWMTRATVSRVLDITALKVELKAGTHQAEQTAPGIVAFDPLFTAKSAPASTEFPADTFSTQPQR
jgi:hypothetical protein